MKVFASLALVALPAAVHATAGGNGNGNGNSASDTTTYLTLNQECKVERKGNNYVSVDGFVCEPEGNTPLECADVDDDGETEGPFTGTCQPLECTGKANPEKGGGNTVTGTNRVTICHRTCSTNNPWVRITIDKDAWGVTYLGDEENGTSGCGHKLQHNVTEDCNRNDYTPWAPYFADYLLIDHGPETDRHDKDYWKIWEPACPSVRNDKGQCCDKTDIFDRGDGKLITTCCGEGPVAEIEVKKYACAASAGCSGTGVPVGCEDDILSLPAGSATKYCISVENKGAFPICEISVTDPLDPEYMPTTNSTNCLWTNSGPVFVSDPLETTPTPGTPETGDVAVVGTPTFFEAPKVYDSDPATILLTGSADVEIKKYACPASVGCSGSGMPAGCLDDDTLTASEGTAMKYCISVQNTGDYPICGIEITDPLFPSGFMPTTNSTNCLWDGTAPVWVDPVSFPAGPSVGSPESSVAKVVAYPEYEGAEQTEDSKVEDTDPATTAVTRVEELSSPAPVNAPTPRNPPTPPSGCPGMQNTGDEICPDGPNVVKPLFSTSDPGDFIWDISFSSSPEGDPLVKFRVENPFTEEADVYVQYHEEVPQKVGVFDAVCAKEPMLPGCDSTASEIEALCITPEGKTPFTVVTIYFVSQASELTGPDVSIPECCYEEAGRDSAAYTKASFTYEIYCGC